MPERRFYFVFSAFVLITIPFAICMTVAAVQVWIYWQRLDQHGVTIRAVIIDTDERCWRDSEGDERCAYYLSYRFDVPEPVGDRKRFTRKEEVPFALYNRYYGLSDSTLVIKYLPDSPTNSVIVGNEHSPIWDILGALGINVLVWACAMLAVHRIRDLRTRIR